MKWASVCECIMWCWLMQQRAKDIKSVRDLIFLFILRIYVCSNAAVVTSPSIKSQESKPRWSSAHTVLICRPCEWILLCVSQINRIETLDDDERYPFIYINPYHVRLRHIKNEEKRNQCDRYTHWQYLQFICIKRIWTAVELIRISKMNAINFLACS